MDDAKTTRPSRLRLGLLGKSLLILVYLVVSVTAAGAWYYVRAVEKMTHANNAVHAGKLAKALSLAAESDLRDGRYEALDQMLTDWVRDPAVPYVAIQDDAGRCISLACSDDRQDEYAQFAARAVAVKGLVRSNDEHLAVSVPIVARDRVWYSERIAGHACLVLNVHQSDRVFTQARVKTIRTAAWICLLGIPIGAMLIWQFLVRPVRRLMPITRQLADGDYDARAGFCSRDETGELAAAFDHMAEEVQASHRKLKAHAEELEHRVADRTAELQDANRRLTEEISDREEFLRAVSHDLNAPMRNIAGMATMTMMKFRDALPEEALARLQRIQANVDTQTGMLQDLLELCRIKSRPQAREWLDLTEVAESVAATFEYELTRRDITVSVQPGMPRIWAEATRMRELLQNLVDNAIKYMHRPMGGLIEILCLRREREYELIVRDNGPGIDAQELQRVFVVFRRATTAGASGVSGKGVGLAVVRTIASSCGGQAWVESQLGEGASFHITFARSNVEPQEQSESADADGAFDTEPIAEETAHA